MRLSNLSSCNILCLTASRLPAWLFGGVDTVSRQYVLFSMNPIYARSSSSEITRFSGGSAALWIDHLIPNKLCPSAYCQEATHSIVCIIEPGGDWGLGDGGWRLAITRKTMPHPHPPTPNRQSLTSRTPA